MVEENITPYQLLERYWYWVNRFDLTQTYILYTRDRLPVAASGTPGLVMERYISKYAQREYETIYLQLHIIPFSPYEYIHGYFGYQGCGQVYFRILKKMEEVDNYGICK